MEVSSELPLWAEERWAQFETQSNLAQLRFDVCFATTLPVFQGGITFETAKIGILKAVDMLIN